MSQHLPAHFISAAESYLNGETGVDVRALSFSDIARIASGDAPLNFEAFKANEQGDLVPVTISVETYRGDRAKVNTTYGIDEGTGRLDRSAPLGARLTLFITEGDGNGESRVHLFTTKAAEKAATATAYAKMDSVRWDDDFSAKATRKSLWLPIDSEVLSEDSTGKVAYKDLAGFHGSKVTATFVVEGIAPSALEAKIHLFLATEFGGAQGSVASVEAYPVLDKRVDVFSMFTGAPVALNILASEVDLLPEASDFSGFDVRPAMNTTDVLVGR